MGRSRSLCGKNPANFIAVLIVILFTFISLAESDIIVYYRNTSQVIEEFHDLPARFGSPFPMNGMKVLAVHAKPSNACTPIESPPAETPRDVRRWVVLIERYECSFEQKVRNAQTAGYDAVIVYNVNSNDLEQMSANDPEGITIPSMFVGETTGKIIIYNYLHEDGYALVLNGDLPFNINTHLILPFAIVVGMCFIIMVGFMIMKCIREQRRLRRHRLPSSVLKKIPTIRFAKEQHMALYEICAICLDDYVDGDKLRVLPCAHAYHSKCIDPWLTKNRRVCPICKRKVFARGEPRQRRRRSSDDSMSDSDVDDTTPLLNPVDHTNHGTFMQPDNAAAAGEERRVAGYPQQRYNPFDRTVNLPVVPENPENSQNSENTQPRWKSFFSYFFTSHADRPVNNTTDDSEILEEGSNYQPNENNSVVVITPAQRSSSSNNILNSNLSGSFKKRQSRGNRTTRNANGDESDDDDGDSGWHEPSDSIFAPVFRGNRLQQPAHSSPDIGPGTSHQRIAVAAIPHPSLQQLTEPVSASTPSVYTRSPQQQRHNSNEPSSQSRGNRSPASSNDYFV